MQTPCLSLEMVWHLELERVMQRLWPRWRGRRQHWISQVWQFPPQQKLPTPFLHWKLYICFPRDSGARGSLPPDQWCHPAIKMDHSTAKLNLRILGLSRLKPLVEALRVVHSTHLDSTWLLISLHGASFWEWPTPRALDYSWNAINPSLGFNVTFFHQYHNKHQTNMQAKKIHHSKHPKCMQAKKTRHKCTIACSSRRSITTSTQMEWWPRNEQHQQQRTHQFWQILKRISIFQASLGAMA